MKIISVSKKRFEKLEPMTLSRGIVNTEAKMYNLTYKNEEKVIKSLYILDDLFFANKLYTLEMLNSNQEYLPTSFLIPDGLFAVNNDIIGFTIPKFDGINLTEILKNGKLDVKEHIYYLKKIGEILHQLESIRAYTPLKDIYINDLHASNFLVDLRKKELKVIDLDSCKIADNKVFPSKYLSKKSILNYSNKYRKVDPDSLGYIIPDKNTDLYCYVMEILNYLYNDKFSRVDIEEFYEYLNYLESLGVNKELLNIFSKIVNNCDNENPEYLLDSLSSEQIFRASKIVYENVKQRKKI